MLHWKSAFNAVWLSPYLGLFLTLASFQLGLWVYKTSKRQAFLHPVIISVVSLCALVVATNLSFERYIKGAGVLSQFLGPVVVALAIPLYQNLAALKRHWLPFVICNVLGGGLTIMVAVVVLTLLNGSDLSIGSMWTKSITTAFALEVSAGIGGLPSLAAAMVMFTGILGALIAPSLFAFFNIYNSTAQGCALGVCAHAVGTAKALELGSEQGAFAALSMSFMGILCALALPVLLG